jgi:hypothetical protein
LIDVHTGGAHHGIHGKWWPAKACASQAGSQDRRKQDTEDIQLPGRKWSYQHWLIMTKFVALMIINNL